VLKAALTGTTLDNNMADNLIYAAKVQDFSFTKVAPTPVTGTLTSVAQVFYSTGNVTATYPTIANSGP
jgi:hypothetical protein